MEYIENRKIYKIEKMSQTLKQKKDYEDNLFTFDQDEQEIQPQEIYQQYPQYQKNQQLTKDNIDHRQIGCQRNNHPSQSTDNNNIFLFDDEELQTQKLPPNDNKNHQAKSNHPQNQQLSNFNSLKSKILFKQQNNFLTSQKLHHSLSQKLNLLKSNNPRLSVQSQIHSNFPSNKIQQQNQNFSSTGKDSLPNSTQKKPSYQTSNDNFQQFKQNQNKNNSVKSTFQFQGAKVFTQPQNSEHFQYVQEQKAIKVANLKQFLFTQLSQQYKVNALIKKVDSGFLDKIANKTKYFVTIEENNKFLFSVLKQGFNKFIFSMNKDDISQKNKNYLGQMISKDFTNTQFVLYDYGFDPKQTKCLQFSYKQLAWIKYEESSGPRKFNVTMSTNNKGFHCIQNDVNIIQKKWAEKNDRKNLCRLYSKEPQFDETDGNYKLDFKGMVGKPSVKNFVLSSKQYEDCLIFARRSDDTYALEVRNPFSLIQAVAVCMSSIYHKSMF